MNTRVNRRVLLGGTAMVVASLTLPSTMRADSGMAGMDMSGMDMGTPQPKTENVIRIVLTLSEFRINVTPNPQPMIQAGQTVEFVIINAGLLSHELMAMPPGMTDMAGMSMEEMDKMAPLTVEPDDLPSGGIPVIKALTLNQPGDWQLHCMLPGHESMKAILHVDP